MGALALQQISDLDAERQRALVDKRKGEIRFAALIAQIGLAIQLGLFGHLLDGESHDFPHFPNAERDFLKLTGHAVHVDFPPFAFHRDK